MSLLSHTTILGHRVRHRRRSAARRRFGASLFNTSNEFTQHMSLDTQSHWRWSNPVNLLPGLVLLLILVLGILL